MTAAGFGLDSCKGDRVLLGKGDRVLLGKAEFGGCRCHWLWNLVLAGFGLRSVLKDSFSTSLQRWQSAATIYLSFANSCLVRCVCTCLKTMQSVEDMQTVVDVESLWRSSEPSSVLLYER